MTRALAAAAAALALGASCAAARTCSAKTCGGCCDAADVCQSSGAPTCGVSGARCTTCGDGLSCEQGTCRVTDAGTGGGSGLTAWQDEILAAHNRLRTDATPAPSPALPPLAWSGAVTFVAQGWAANCTFGHNPARGQLGENLYAGTASSPGTAVVASWASEAADYALATNTCAAGRECGHYTQLVWRNTTAVGCAQQQCTTNSPFGGSAPWFLVVCDYSPPGNVLGETPY